jgi:hypothetical protein
MSLGTIRSLFFGLSFELCLGSIAWDFDFYAYYLDWRFQLPRIEPCWAAGRLEEFLEGRAGVGNLDTGIMLRFRLLYSKFGC